MMMNGGRVDRDGISNSRADEGRMDGDMMRDALDVNFRLRRSL